MGGFSMWHWLVVVFLFYAIFLVIPIWRILQRTGFPGVLSLLVLVPMVNLICLWLFAFMAWPRDRRIS